MSESDRKKAMHHPNTLGAGAEKRRQLHSKQDKVHTVMSEFKRGTLHSGSGDIVTKRKQAIAIAMHESGQDKNTPKHSHKKVHHSPTMEQYDMQKIHSHDTPTSEEC